MQSIAEEKGGMKNKKKFPPPGSQKGNDVLEREFE